MQEIEFNLLTEPWVRVRLPDNTVQEVSLTDALVHAQEYMDLAGEMPTQDAAMLRLLLAVLFTVFSRVNEVGEPEPLEDEEAALERWGALWELKRFPEQPIRDYLEQWKDRFWLFHPERPFWQVPEAKIGSPFKGGKLNGEVFESENKNNMFASYAGVEKNALTYAQAARWLVFLNNYDDAAAKKKAKDRPSMSPGWLGQLGLVYVKGVNLFETLMRNLMFLNDRAELWEKGRPNWELEEPRSEERTEIVCPGNYAELLTMQCRRIWLERENEKVVRYTLLGGDFFDKKNAFAEPMTLWGLRKQTKESPECYLPQKHDMEKMLWREFSSIIGDGKHIPGVVQWNGYLQRCGLLKKKEILQICAVGVEYGAQSASMKGVYADQIAMSLSLLNELGYGWQNRITEEIGRCEKAASLVGHLAQDIATAAGDKNGNASAPARSQFYFAVDQPFRQWLRSIDPEEDDMTETTARWQGIARGIAEQLGQQMVLEAGSAALVGHWVEIKTGRKKEDKKKILYTAPAAYNSFLGRLYGLYPKTNDEGGTA